MEVIRRKTLRRFVRLGVLDRDSAREMLAWEHSGFSLHAATVIAQGDRAALERLLYYCARPALSVRRLTYRKEEGLAVYEARDKANGSRRLVFTPAEFIGRLARLVPPPRKNIVRYYGALAPNSPLRPLVAEAAQALSAEPPLATVRRAAEGAVAAASASARAWAKILSRVFEVDPLACLNCGGRLEPVAAILADKQLVRLLAHLELPTDFPTLAPARGRAQTGSEPDPSIFLGADPSAPSPRPRARARPSAAG